MPDKVIISDGPCGCCGTECFLTVSGDGSGVDLALSGNQYYDEGFRFFDETTAAAYLTSTSVAGCWVHVPLWFGVDTSFSVSGSIIGQAYSLTANVLSTEPEAVGAHVDAGCKVFIFAATGLDVDTAVNCGGGTAGTPQTNASFAAYQDGVLIDSDVIFDLSTSVSGTLHIDVPEDGYYEVYFQGLTNLSGAAVTVAADFSFTLDEGATHCPLRAVYGDEGDPDTWEYLICE